MNQGMKQFAPETAVGTGAAEPVVDEYEAAKAVPSVDENTLKEGRSQNQPGRAGSIDYSNETRSEAIDKDDAAQAPKVNDDTDEAPSTGEDYETRNKDDETLAGAAVSEDDDAEVNKPAADVRPEVPQATKRTRKAKGEQ